EGGEGAGAVLPGAPVPGVDADAGGGGEGEVVAAVAVDVAEGDAEAPGRAGQAVVGEGEAAGAVAAVDGTGVVGRREVGVPVAVDVAEGEDEAGVAFEEAERVRPRPVALVEVDLHAGGAAEAAGADVEVAVVIDVGEVGAEEAPVLAVGGEAVVPGLPALARAVAEGHLEELVAEVDAGVVVVDAVADVEEAVAVDVAEGDAARSEERRVGKGGG